MTDIRAYRVGDPHDVAGLVDVDGSQVVAVDPGAQGIALLFPRVANWIFHTTKERFGRVTAPKPLSFELRGYTGVRDLVPFLHGGPGRTTVVVEESFGGGRLNMAADLQLARYTGAVIGYLAETVPSCSFVFVNARSWLGVLGKVGNRVTRAQRKQMSNKHTVGELGQSAVDASSSRAPHREAFCDAYTMACWWGTYSSRITHSKRRTA